MQPGEVVGPGGTPENTEKPAEQPPVSPVPESESHATQQFDHQADQRKTDLPTPQGAVTWTASEYIAHEKSAGWYLMLAGAAALSAALVFVITRELVSPVVIIIMAVAFGVFAARKPQELTYTLDNTALQIGTKPYLYSQFKSFTVVEEGAIHSIMLIPLQRFMPPISVYYDPEDEDKITDALNAYLPYEDRKQDAVDRLMRRVRF